MEVLSRDKDTICALSTPPGHGGIAVIRLSGSRSLSIARSLAPFLSTQKTESHRAYFGRLQSQDRQTIDEAVVTIFAQGKSYTGEETVEFSTHGSPHVVSFLLEELVKQGARMAEAGEFTYRAFMNDQLDLVQAEAVLNLIEGQSRKAVVNATRQLSGELSQDFTHIEEKLVRVMAHLEAGIDFSTEDISPYQMEELLDELRKVAARVDRLMESFNSGKILQDGFRIAIVGRPNSGKSSLLNAIVKEDRAIVTDVPGTTRDVLSADLMVNGLLLRWVDTAGIRETEDQVETLGIERSIQEIGKADLILALVDLSQNDLVEDLAFLRSLEDKDCWVIGSKKDISCFGPDMTFAEYLQKNSIAQSRSFEICSHQAESLHPLIEAVSVEAGQGLVSENHVVTSARQVEDLKHIKISIEKAMDLLAKSESPEFTAFEMQEAVLAVHRLLGKEYDDQVMDQVFSEFCIGK